MSFRTCAVLFLTHSVYIHVNTLSFHDVPLLSPAEYPVEWRHHRLRHRLRWLWLQFVSGGTSWHAEATSLHQAASEQVPLWPGGTTVHTQIQWPVKIRIPLTCVVVMSSLYFFHRCIFPCSFTNINTTAQDSSLLMTPSMSNSATYWAQRRRKSKMRRNSRVKTKKIPGICVSVTKQK